MAKTVELKREEVPGKGCCIEETSFATLFPSYLESYFRSVWEEIRLVLKANEIKGELNLLEGCLTVRTTPKTWDPLAILKARDFIRLLARSVPVAQAQKIFDDDTTYDIIKIGNIVDNTRRFVKRRERLVGPHGQTLKTLEILTGCYVLVQGKTVAVMGPEAGVKQVRSIVTDCMHNIHPVYGLKRLMILKELQTREDLKNEDWSRFLPSYYKKHQKKSSETEKKKRERELEKAKPKSVFPPQPQPRKEDIAMMTGEAFLNPPKRRRKTKKGLDAENGGEEADLALHEEMDDN
eukprot:PhF_6_TR5002/c0_g1_i1/m.7080/K06961/KRR1; ribosomal RNA assembly protein